MQMIIVRWMACLLLAVAIPAGLSGAAHGQGRNKYSDSELREKIKKSIEQGAGYLRRVQNNDGAFRGGGPNAPGARGRFEPYEIGLTSLAVMALINSDVPVESPVVQKALDFLRKVPANEPRDVYQASVMVMALCAAEDYQRDMSRIRQLTGLIERSQVVEGINSGLWPYDLKGRGRNYNPDRSNGQFAVLALRDAAYAGVQISQETWQRTHDHWTQRQGRDGGWSYKASDGGSTGSMTAAGLSTLAITTRMLDDDGDVGADGRADCCTEQSPSEALALGRAWMARNFSVFQNPRNQNGHWHYYYLYGLERAGRLSYTRFFGNRDWYREGAEFLVDAQLAGGEWLSRDTQAEREPVFNTSLAMLFLSKGLSRVVVNKLDYTSPRGERDEGGEWNRHPRDVPNLVELVDRLPDWPPRLTSQVITLSRLTENTAVSDLNQSPVLYLSGREAPRLTDEAVGWLRRYIDEGGFLFAVANCDGEQFDQGFRELIPRLFPDGDASLQRLTADHPVYRSEYLLNADTVELHGVDFGCRTAVIYCPDDIACYWQKWMQHDPPGRNRNLIQRIIRGTRIGVNILAYATGREPPEKLNDDLKGDGGSEAEIRRGLLQVAKLRHSGGWDTAPRALRNLLLALNETVGLAASTQPESVPVTADELRRFPLTYMHGRYRFRLGDESREALRTWLDRGGLLFADACCGSEQFDRSFRDLIAELYPGRELEPIPADHELYTETIGHEIRETRRRRLVPTAGNASLQARVESGPPVLEGIQVGGRYAVIYSRYDISCALEKQASLACDGYVEEDAVRLAVNVVLYSLLRDPSVPETTAD